MSHAIAVHHGAFGRAALYELDKPIVTHAHREGHLIFYVNGAGTHVLVGDTSVPLDVNAAVAVSPWEPHSFELPDDSEPCLCLVLYIKPIWFLETCQSARFVLHFGAPSISVTPEIENWIRRLTSTLLEEQGSDLLDGYLYEATRQCYTPNLYLNTLRAEQAIENLMTTDKSITDIGYDLGFSSQARFTRFFASNVGILPSEYRRVAHLA